MQQEDQRSVPAQVPVDEGERELHQHGRYESEEKRESLPDLVPSEAVCGTQVQRCRRLGREQRHRHKDGTRESHPRSLRHLRNAALCFARRRHIHKVSHRRGRSERATARPKLSLPLRRICAEAAEGRGGSTDGRLGALLSLKRQSESVISFDWCVRKENQLQLFQLPI